MEEEEGVTMEVIMEEEAVTMEEEEAVVSTTITTTTTTTDVMPTMVPVEGESVEDLAFYFTCFFSSGTTIMVAGHLPGLFLVSWSL